MKMFKKSVPMALSLTLLACSSSNNEAVTPDVVADTPAPASDTTTPDTKTPVTMKVVEEPIPGADPKPGTPSTPVLTLAFTPTKTKAFRFTWETVSGATFYKLTENITTTSGYEVVETTTATATSFDHIVPLYARLNAKYVLQSCNAVGCTASVEVFTSTRVSDMVDSIGYFKASNTDASDFFGYSVSISEDGSTLAVGARSEDSNSQADQTNGSANNAGAVYVFTRNITSAVWSQQAYLKAIIADASGFLFGHSVSLSANGNTLAVGAIGEGGGSGAAYVFTRSGTTWTQEKYLKASNPSRNDNFGTTVSLSANGHALAVGAPFEDGSAMGDGEDQDDRALPDAGAAYVFARTVDEDDDITWAQEKYLKARNADSGDGFGLHVSLSADGHTLAVGAPYENGSATSDGEGEDNNGASGAGAVYVFTLVDTTWDQQAYLKATIADELDWFGFSVSLSTDGNTLAVGAPQEGSMATGVNNSALQSDNSATGSGSGAAYVFIRNTIPTTPVWSQQAYLKANNTGADDEFGLSVSISADGNTLAVSAKNEGSNAVGIDNEGPTSNGAGGSGAVYTFTRPATTTTWSQQAYIKARNTGGDDAFGYSLALSADGDTLAVSASNEDSNTKGVNAGQENDKAGNAGAVYVY